MPSSPRRPAPVRGPIFIVGTMGSGTTLLRLMLDSHERIAVPHETGFMRAYDAMQFIPFKWTGRGWARRLGWSQEELDEKLRGFFDDIFMRYAEEHGKERWGEKTPLHTWHIGAMKRGFPDSVFVGMARHPGAAVASNMRRFNLSLERSINHYERYAKEIARQAGRLRKRMIVLRYEDLLLRTEPVMRELLEWLGESWSEQVLHHHVVQSEERRHERIEGKTRADDSIDTSRISRWTGAFSEDDRRVLDRRLGRLAEFYGYSMEDPEHLAPLSETPSLLFGGREVGARIDAFPDLDIRTRMQVPIYDHRYDPRRFDMVRKPAADRRQAQPQGGRTVGRAARSLRRAIRKG